MEKEKNLIEDLKEKKLANSNLKINNKINNFINDNNYLLAYEKDKQKEKNKKEKNITNNKENKTFKKSDKINIFNIYNLFSPYGIFSFLNQKQKLNMIIYNKKLQKMMLVNIENYKNISGKYKIGGKNGYGKEYIIKLNILRFEGEYLNGKRNGIGKEYYYDGKLEFEGEYLNGKKMEKEKNIIIMVH